MNYMTLCHDENDIIIREQIKGITSINKYKYDEMQDYFTTLFLNFKESAIFWIQDLRLYAESIIEMLNYMGWKDVTEEGPKVKSMPSKSFQYLIELRGNAYRLVIKNNKKAIYIYNTDNLLANITNEEIIHDFGKRTDDFLTDLVNASFTAISMLGGFQNSKTPFTISMVAAREWKEIERLRGCELITDCREFKSPDEQMSLPEYLRDAYTGGWNYMNDAIPEKKYRNKPGAVYDVNSLYPYVMATKPIPYGKPTNFIGPEIPFRDDDKYYYYVRVVITFDLKKGKHFPYIRRKGDFRYRIMEYLETSDIVTIDNNGDKKRCSKIINLNGELEDVKVELVLSKTDYELIHRHYDIHSEEILDGVYYKTANYTFKHFVSKYYNMKATAKATQNYGEYRISKMIMNALCGTLAKRDERTNIFYKYENNRYTLVPMTEKNSSASYIHMAAAILSYAREITYEAACANYDNFLYADTDSIHVFGKKFIPKGIEIDDKKLGCWKIEKTFTDAYYMKRKNYILKTNEEEDPYKITMAGVSYGCKELIQDALNKHEPMQILKDASDGKYLDASDVFKKVMRIITDYYGDIADEVETYSQMAMKYLEFAKECRENDPITILNYVKFPTSMTFCENFRIYHRLEWKYIRN